MRENFIIDERKIVLLEEGIGIISNNESRNGYRTSTIKPTGESGENTQAEVIFEFNTMEKNTFAALHAMNEFGNEWINTLAVNPDNLRAAVFSKFLLKALELSPQNPYVRPAHLEKIKNVLSTGLFNNDAIQISNSPSGFSKSSINKLSTYEVKVQTENRPIVRPAYVELGLAVGDWNNAYKKELINYISKRINPVVSILVGLTSGLSTQQVLQSFSPSNNPFKALKNDPEIALNELDQILMIDFKDRSVNELKRVPNLTRQAQADVNQWISRYYDSSAESHPNWKVLLAPLPYGFYNEAVTCKLNSLEELVLANALKKGLGIGSQELAKLTNLITTNIYSTSLSLDYIPDRDWKKYRGRPGYKLREFQDLMLIAEHVYFEEV
jgi:hypothetical protein